MSSKGHAPRRPMLRPGGSLARPEPLRLAIGQGQLVHKGFRAVLLDRDAALHAPGWCRLEGYRP